MYIAAVILVRTRTSSYVGSSLNVTVTLLTHYINVLKKILTIICILLGLYYVDCQLVQVPMKKLI